MIQTDFYPMTPEYEAEYLSLLPEYRDENEYLTMSYSEDSEYEPDYSVYDYWMQLLISSDWGGAYD